MASISIRNLVKRYGNEYVDFRRNVPRWIPRVSAWDPTLAARTDT